MLFILAQLIVLFGAVIVHTKDLWPSVACIARCKSDGSLLEVWSEGEGCRPRTNEETAEDACHAAYAWENGPFCGEKDLTNWMKTYGDPSYPAFFYYVEFEDLTRCNAYYKDAIAPAISSNSTLAKTESDIKEAQCGCTDMVSSILNKGKEEMLQGNTFCSNIFGFLSIESRTCRFTSKIPLVNLVCEKILGVVDGVLDKVVFEPVCGMILRLIKEITTVDIDSLYSKVDFKEITDRVSKRTCGTLTCNKELSDVCLKVDFGPAMSSAKVLESISQSHCSAVAKNSNSTGHMPACNMLIGGMSAAGVMLAAR